MSRTDNSELRGLLAGWTEDLLSEQEQQRLAEILASDPAARDLYVRHMALHADLERGHLPAPAATVGRLPATSSKSARWRAAALTVLQWRIHPVRFATFILALTGVVWACFLAVVLPWWRAEQFVVAPPVAQSRSLVAAQLTDAVDCQWTDGDPPQLGTYIFRGRTLGLESGIAEFTFRDGVVAVLEGPAELVFEATDRATLKAGRLVARVESSPSSEESSGKSQPAFTVYTKMLAVEDLGTEFGVAASPGNDTEVRVFDGVVNVTFVGDTGENKGQQRRLVAGESLIVGPEGVLPPASIVAGQEFKRSVPAVAPAASRYRDRVLADKPVAFWPLRARGLSTGDDLAGGRRGTWTGRYFGNTGGPSRFDGQTSVMDVDYAESLNPDAFTLEARVRTDGSGKDFQTIISSRDDQLDPADGIRSRGYMLYVAPEGNLEFWTGQGAGWHELEGPFLWTDEWTHIAATFEPTDRDGAVIIGTKRLYVNGELSVEQADCRYAPHAARRHPLRIGAGQNESSPTYFFSGKICDVAVYGRVLDDRSIQKRLAPHD
jgi:hypothetical protein